MSMDEEYMTMNDGKQAAQNVSTAAKFSEAPYSGNVRARIRGYDWQLTIRAADSTTFTAKIDGLMNWLDLKADKAVNLELPPNVPAPVAPAATAPQAPAASGMQTIHAVKMTVTPRADGKAELAFYEAGHQYPDIKAVQTPNEAQSLLKTTGAWQPQHFAAVAEYQVNMLIDWKPSANLNKNGKPYKNIVTISAA